MRRIFLALAATAAMVFSTTPTGVAQPESDGGLAEVRKATAKFHSLRQAERAGHQLGYIEPFLLDGCIAHPTEGAMGYHWFNHDGIHDTTLDPRRPEGLVYAPARNGKLRLAAVEWIVPRELWEAEGNTEPPELLGQQLHVLNPALGWYILHAWVWLPNPSGMFSDWNPRVDCG